MLNATVLVVAIFWCGRTWEDGARHGRRYMKSLGNCHDASTIDPFVDRWPRGHDATIPRCDPRRARPHTTPAGRRAVEKGPDLTSGEHGIAVAYRKMDTLC
jgi:hypothetical protein